MTKNAAALLAEAMALPDEERRTLDNELLASVEDDPDTIEAWLDGAPARSRRWPKAWACRSTDCTTGSAPPARAEVVAESFFASLKKERLHHAAFATRTEAYDAVESYIEGFYNPTRRHSALGYVSPLQYEQATVSMAA